VDKATERGGRDRRDREWERVRGGKRDEKRKRRGGGELERGESGRKVIIKKREGMERGELSGEQWRVRIKKEGGA